MAIFEQDREKGRAENLVTESKESGCRGGGAGGASRPKTPDSVCWPRKAAATTGGRAGMVAPIPSKWHHLINRPHSYPFSPTPMVGSPGGWFALLGAIEAPAPSPVLLAASRPLGAWC